MDTWSEHESCISAPDFGIAFQGFLLLRVAQHKQEAVADVLHISLVNQTIMNTEFLQHRREELPFLTVPSLQFAEQIFDLHVHRLRFSTSQSSLLKKS